MNVTDGDRERAAELLRGAYRQEAIAGALADEREKARDVFLAVGQDLQAAALMAPSCDEERAYRDADARIRRAAEATE